MEQTLVVQFDEDPVHFTPDGRVSVLDILRALTQSEHPECLWERIKEEHPEILDHCEDYFFRPGQSHPVVDKEGWEMLLNQLTGYFSYAPLSSCSEGAN